MIGVKVKERGARGAAWTIVASEAGRWIIQPDEFGSAPARRVTAADLATEFNVKSAPDATTTEEAAQAATLPWAWGNAPSIDDLWTANAAGYEPPTSRPVPAGPGALPEDVFTLADDSAPEEVRTTASERIARSIVADPAKREQAQAGSLRMHPDVFRLVRDLLKAEATR